MTSTVVIQLIAAAVTGLISVVALAAIVNGFVRQHLDLGDMLDRFGVCLGMGALCVLFLFGLKPFLAILGIVSGACFVAALMATANGFLRQKKKAGELRPRMLAAGLCGLVCTVSLAGCNGALSELGNNADTAATGDEVTTLEATTVGAEDFAEDAFIVDLDEAGMEDFRKQIFGPDITMDQLKAGYSADQDPYNAQKRIDAVKAGCRLWSGNPDHPGFENPVWKPATSILELGRYGWENLSTADKETKLDAVQRAVCQQAFKSPIFADMLYQQMLTFDQKYSNIISSRSPWFVNLGNLMEQYYASEAGIANWFDKKANELAPNLLGDEYIDYLTKLCALWIGNFDWASDLGCAGNYTSICYWNLPVNADSNHARTERVDDPNEQDNKFAFLFSHTLKSGSRVMLGGINAFDLSLAIYAPNTQVPQAPVVTPVEQPIPSRPSNPPTNLVIVPSDPDPVQPKPEKPQPEQPRDDIPKTAQLVIKYREKGTDKKMSDIAGSRYADIYRTVDVNGKYSVTSPKAPDGYKGPDIAVVSGTMTSRGASYTVYYEKTGNIKVTVEYRERNYQEHEVAKAKVLGYYAAGETIKVKPIEIEGYQPTQSEFSGTTLPNKDGMVIICWYDGEVTVRYWWWDRHEQAAPTVCKPKEFGKWFTIPAAVSHDGYEPSPDPVYDIKQSGPMEFDVYYYPIDEPGPKPDGQGGKDKNESNGNKHPDHPNGDLNPGDGTGDDQPTEPPANDRKPSDNIGNKGTASSDDRQTVSDTPKKPTDNKESSGATGQDHYIGSGDKNLDHGSTPPSKTEHKAESTTVTSTGSSGQTTTSNPADHNSSNGNSASTVVSSPDMED